MSKRFGRNQKRRLREQLDRLTHNNAYYVRELGHVRERLLYIEEAARRLQYPGLLPPQVIVVDHTTQTCRIDVAPRPSFEVLLATEPAPETAMQVLDTVALAHAIELNPQTFNLDVHFFAEGPDHQRHVWAYHVSPRMLAKGIGPRERRDIANRIGGDIVAAAHRHFRLKGGF